ncbi:hypothetical protein F503_07803 [Ophiostoma piceae UAMH 11346]|uniref:Protein kinase domain-containing protein n=1 Tax=Ophiostoma piceae (strain UAMH 11346) TaxID=1262450 RepID=S3C307_OPHP1|nr:hypothetical protein F503_07803 [Ophiostoma piceae UAMH 11346]
MDSNGRKIWTNSEAWSLWEPLPDTNKPGLPYRPGLRLSIRRHMPRPPFGNYYKSERPTRTEADRQEKFHRTQSEWCLMRPPSISPPHPDPVVEGLQVIDEVACEDGRGAQLVRCRLDTDPERIMVAKIYDAFYYDYMLPVGGPCDVTRVADNHYSREAAAYEALADAKADGRLVPKYYGSWTFNLPVPDALQSFNSSSSDSTIRPVHMILMEWIEGISIDKLLQDERTVKSIEPALRLKILAKAMEVFCMVESCGVRHNDLAPRNVVLSPAYGWTTRMPAVFLIDFNVADTTRSPYYQGKKVTPPLPINPRHRFFHHYMPEFGRWIPRRYRKSTTFNGWLSTRWAPDEEGFLLPNPTDREYYENEVYYECVPHGPDSPLWTPGCGRPFDDDEY